MAAPRLLVALLLAATLAMPLVPTAYAQAACDFNGDGMVGDAERKRCHALFTCDADRDGKLNDREKANCPAFDRCDTDRDGRVDDAELKACQGTTTTDPTGGRDPCDLNADGKVDDLERQRCAGSTPPIGECDTNKDGVTDRAEAEQCKYSPCDTNKDGLVTEAERTGCVGIECDFNRDGAVSEAEKTRCGRTTRDPCDANGDGVVTEAEKANCRRDPCDFDANGIVDDAERKRCSGGTPCDFDGNGVIDSKERLQCAPDPCDYNGDGFVDGAEKERCAKAQRDPCDLDGNGVVDAAEKEKCAATFHDKCDLDRNGVVSPEERMRCGGDPCDFNGDGFVDDFERRRCSGDVQEKCDFDRNGRVDDAERQRCAGAFDRCDSNQDGKVDEHEKARCAESFRDRCDLDGNGVTTEEERRRCYSQTFDRCDFDRDGTVSDAEREKCAAIVQSRCDTNGDGFVDESEKRACAPTGDRCDFNGDGRVDEAEKGRCAQATASSPSAPQRPPPPPPPMVSEDCRQALKALEERRSTFDADVRSRWDAFARDQQLRLEAFFKAGPNETAIAEFKVKLAAERQPFEMEIRKLVEGFDVAHERPAACQGQAHMTGAPPPCRPDEAQYERFRGYVDEQQRTAREGLEARGRDFLQVQARERAEFAASNRTAADLDAFLKLQAEANAKFHADLEAEALKVRAHFDEQWSLFKEKASRACIQGGAPPTDVKLVQADARAGHLECGLDVQAKIDLFFQKHGRDASNWTEEALGAYVSLKGESRLLREACEERIHVKWQEQATKAFQEQKARVERFGSIEVEGTERGGTASGRFVAFRYDADGVTMLDYSVQGLRLFERFRSPLHAQPRLEGALLRLHGETDGAVLDLAIHDNPSGLFEGACVSVKARAAAPGAAGASVLGDKDACLLKFPDHARIQRSDAEGVSKYAIALGDVTAILYVHGPHEWMGNELTLRAKWRLLAPLPEFVFAEFANKHRDDIRQAVDKGHVLAEVNVVKEGAKLRTGASELAGLEADGSQTKVEVEVKPKGDNGVVIDYDTTASKGKTVVFNLDAALFVGSPEKAEDFVVDYFEVDANGTEKKVTLKKADSLTDVLDPAEADPEWWIVVDAKGIQLLVSQGHFSAKRVVVQSAQPSAATPPPTATPQEGATTAETPTLPLLGLLAAAALVAVARRRRS